MNKIKTSLLAVIFWVIVLYAVTENDYHGWRFIDLKIVLSNVKDIIFTSETFGAILNTLTRLLKYFLIITVSATVMAIVSYRSKVIEELLKPLVVSLKAIPVVASILLIYLIFNRNNVGLIIVFLMVFPMLYSTFIGSLNKIPSTWERHNEVHKISKLKRVTDMYLPIMFLRNKVQIVAAIGLALKSLIASEILTSTDGGVGYEIINANLYIDTNLMFAWLVVLTMIIVLIDFGFKKLLKAGDANE